MAAFALSDALPGFRQPRAADRPRPRCRKPEPCVEALPPRLPSIVEAVIAEAVAKAEAAVADQLVGASTRRRCRPSATTMPAERDAAAAAVSARKRPR